mmetsp:Transcript_141446/g.439641  ORF Transcript_141446/g.439641 Transcript_141446/m.439641 type:complete len:214 (+) Transcript_141446:739-1380(+)
MGTLLNCPLWISSRGLPNRVMLSTSACQPSPAAKFPKPRFRAKTPAPIAEFQKEGEVTLLISSSATQSYFQSLPASFLFRQLTVLESFGCLHRLLSMMKSVCIRFVFGLQTSATGEFMTTRLKRPTDPGATRWERTAPQPSLWPCSVTRVGSPPKAEMCCCTQRMSSCWSCMPMLWGTPESGTEIQPKMPRRKSKLMKITGCVSDCTIRSPWR